MKFKKDKHNENELYWLVQDIYNGLKHFRHFKRACNWELVYEPLIGFKTHCEHPDRIPIFKKSMERGDIYIYHAENKGFTANVNRGWKAATGDFVIIANSDVKLIKGNLKDLCIPGKVTSPHIVNQDINGLAGCFFCVPKEIAEERGMLNEDMKTYYSDQDYADRTADIFERVWGVEVWHEQMQTVKEAGVEGKMEEDKAKYEAL